MAIYLGEENTSLDKYIKLGQPSCYVEHYMFCRARYAISDCHVIDVHVYNRSILITQTSLGYHFNKHALHIWPNTLYTYAISCYLTSAWSTIPFCTYKPHVLCHN